MTISCVIPVYNSERYLARCVDSILNQTRVPDEVILVDDGSVDNSPAICDRFVDSDDYVDGDYIEELEKGYWKAAKNRYRPAAGSRRMSLRAERPATLQTLSRPVYIREKISENCAGTFLEMRSAPSAFPGA